MPLLGLRIIRSGCRQLDPRRAASLCVVKTLRPECPDPSVSRVE